MFRIVAILFSGESFKFLAIYSFLIKSLLFKRIVILSNSFKYLSFNFFIYSKYVILSEIFSNSLILLANSLFVFAFSLTVNPKTKYLHK